ncbi:MAG TPA: sigma-70 family RNA polymerase sigma factor [Pseudonocardia sp.]|nr:sigma-70 family RNA polymerase sigma factor [Pseudonocardia sp.]
MSAPAYDDELTRCALAAGRGDTIALATFVRATQRDVHRFVCTLIGRADAEDVAQETYLRALNSLPRFAARSSARTWLFSIARRAAADHVRVAMRTPRTSSVPDWEVLAQRQGPSTGSDDRVLLWDLVAALDTDRREAFSLTQILGLGYAEAAEVCGCPVGTIRSRVARARADLVAALDGRVTAPSPPRDLAQ